MKTCPKCRLELPVFAFNARFVRNGKRFLQSRCRSCQAIDKKARRKARRQSGDETFLAKEREKNRVRIAAAKKRLKSAPPSMSTMKTCPKCRRSLSLDNFSSHPGRAFGRSRCRDCSSADAKERRIKGGEERLAKERAKANARYAIDPGFREKKRTRIREYQRTPRGIRGNKHSKIYADYGITIDEYESKLGEQNGLCRICRMINDSGRALSIDHVHVRGFDALPPEIKRRFIRGLLCERCNRALGLFRDDPALMRMAAEYVAEMIDALAV